MAVIARTPAQVIAGEMTYANAEASWRDALAIASVISNRATALGVTQQQVIGKQSEFNAYGKSLPYGANVDLAQQALDNVNQFGPTTTATFYAMPRAVDNLPTGLNQVGAVEGGHRYFEDPQERAIKTSVGYRAPTNLATSRIAAAQRLEYEERLAAEEGMPVPEERPQTIPVTQNPALMAAAPLAMVDPNIATGVPAMSALTMMPDMALAQSLQPTQAAIESPQALQAALSSLGAGITAQRDFMPTVDVAKGARPGQTAMPSVDVAKGSRIGSVDSARFGDQVGPVARSVKTVSVPGVIDSPQALSDALSVMGLEQGMDAQRTTMPTVAGVKTDRAIASPQSRFAGPQNVPISNADIARAFVNPTGQSQFDPSFTEGLMSASNPVVPSAVPTAAITPDMINSPEKLAAALSALSDAQPTVAATTANPLQAAVDSAVKGPTPALSADSALQAAAGVNSPEMQAMRDRVRQQSVDLQKAVEEANANGKMVSFERTMIPEDVPSNLASQSNLAEGLMATRSPEDAVTAGASLDAATPTAEASLSSATRTAPSTTMTPEQKSAYAEMAQAGFGAGMLNLAGTGRINGFGDFVPTAAATPTATPSDFAAEVKAGLPQKDEYDTIRSNVSKLAPAQATPEEIQNTLVEYNRVPTPTFNPLNPVNTPAAVTKEETPAPELETITVPDLPAVKSYTPPVTKTVPSSTKSMPAVQQRQSTAMDVWSGKASTGVATDGSTVSRLSDNRIGRYVPSQDYTVFSQDDGATWSSPVAGNQLTPSSATNSQMASIQPAVSRSLVDRLVSALTGQPTASVSPTDLGAPMGLDGGMSVGRDGPAGAPGGWGPGGSIGSSGPAGGYGATRGKDPNGTY